MKTWKVEAAIIAVGMVLLGVIIKWGINDFIDTLIPQHYYKIFFLST